MAEEDLRYGITDHANDGGIDAIYILANRNTPVRDDLDVATSGTDRLRIVIFQVKSSDSETGYPLSFSFALGDRTKRIPKSNPDDRYRKSCLESHESGVSP